MKFANLVCPISCCEVGEYVRLSRTTQIVQILQVNGFFVDVRLVGGGFSSVELSRRVHRKID